MTATLGKGIFITLEGGEGAGKSTQIPVIRDFLQHRGFKVTCLREPGGTPIAEEIRGVLKQPRTEEHLCSECELLLMYAARAQLTSTVIRPALAHGEAVICDRYDLSTMAYQGGGRCLDPEMIASIRKAAIGDFKPDLTLLLDIEVETGMRRARGRGALDRFEQEQGEFFARVRQAYLEAAAADPDTIRIVDAAQNQAAVSADCLKIIAGYLDARTLA